VNPLTVRRIVIRHLFRLLTNIKTCRTVRTPQPNAPDLVAVDITERLPVQDMLEIGRRIARVDDRPSGGLARARFVQKGQERTGRLEGDVDGAVKLEKHVAGVVDPVRPELADGALGGVLERNKFGRRYERSGVHVRGCKAPALTGSWHIGISCP
jgi:hypothetical protein